MDIIDIVNHIKQQPVVGEIIYDFSPMEPFAIHLADKSTLVAIRCNKSDSFRAPMFDSLVGLNDDDGCSKIVESLHAFTTNDTLFNACVFASYHVNVCFDNIDLSMRVSSFVKPLLDVSVFVGDDEFYQLDVSIEGAIRFVKIVAAILAATKRDGEYVIENYRIESKDSTLVVEQMGDHPITFYFERGADIHHVLGVIGISEEK